MVVAEGVHSLAQDLERGVRPLARQTGGETVQQAGLRDDATVALIQRHQVPAADQVVASEQIVARHQSHGAEASHQRGVGTRGAVQHGLQRCDVGTRVPIPGEQPEGRLQCGKGVLVVTAVGENRKTLAPQMGGAHPVAHGVESPGAFEERRTTCCSAGQACASSLSRFTSLFLPAIRRRLRGVRSTL